jgi:1-acyl-sn-glycerol-3-phosphate acyltransferase
VSSLRASIRLGLFLAFTLALMPVQWLGLKCRFGYVRRLPNAYHRALCRLFGLEVARRGEPLAEGPLLMVANHASWLDIVVLSSIGPLSFIARHDVAGWPLVGTLARLQRTVFVERKRSRTAQHRDEIVERLAAGDRLVLFAEGTSSDGNRVLPFKTGLFGAVERSLNGRPATVQPVTVQPVTVQPVTVAYTHLDGIPLGHRYRHYYAWYGEMTLLPHLWRVLRQGRARIVVHCHAPVNPADFTDRKALALHCERTVAAGLAEALTGRPPGGRGAAGIEAALPERA